MFERTIFRPVVVALALAAIACPVRAGDAPIDTFRADVEARDKALEAMKLDFYDTVELVSERTARVTVTEDWMKYVTPKDDQGNINTLFDSWRFSHGPDATGVTLIVVAPDGEVIRERSN